MAEGLRQQKIFFIINPAAGGGQAGSWWRQTLPGLEGSGLDFFWQYSEGGAATSRQVRRAVLENGATAVLAVGGDGHIHDALDGLIDHDALLKPGLTLGVYPAGSACDFARMIYTNNGDTSKDALLHLLLQGKTRLVDIGRADFFGADGGERQAYFINGCDIGLGAETCLRVNARAGLLKRLVRSGQLAFLLAALQALCGFRYQAVSVEADGASWQDDYLIAAAGNGRFMGGNMQLFPQASLDDGLLDLFLVRRLPKLKILPLFAKVYNGTVLEVKEVCYRQVRELSLAPKQPLPLELDGELPGLTPLRVRVLPRLLPLLRF